MKEKILALLKQQDGYISGQELCEKFGVSRTAVWKAIKQLQNEGYQIEAVNNKGYHLLEESDVLTDTEIKEKLHTKVMGKELICYKETGSTNNDAKRMAEEGAAHGTMIVADMQTGGRGRRGREWKSASGESIAMTLLLRPDILPENASMLTLVGALALTDAIDSLTTGSCRIKWPNDIVLNEKKLCGILTEMSTETDYIHYVVIGSGVNANQTSFPEEIQSVATSICIEEGKKCNRAAIVAKYLEEFEKYYDIFVKTQDMSGLIEQYNSILVNKDRVVRILDPKGEFTGTALGIDERGELMVRLDHGEIVKVYAGEVSVRGLYGYT